MLISINLTYFKMYIGSVFSFCSEYSYLKGLLIASFYKVHLILISFYSYWSESRQIALLWWDS